NECQFQDDEIGQAINEVVANGAVYLSSSGNEGSLKKGTSTTWEGDFLDGGGASAPIPSGRVHNFGGKNYNRLLKRDSRVTLQWSDEYNSSDNDYDLYILSADGLSVVSSSTNTQDGEQEPMESVDEVHPGERIVIWKASEAAARYLRISCTGSPIEFATAGQTIGHAGTANCICVASSDASLADPAFTTASLVENSSSDGPHKMFYNPDGSAITPGDFLSSGGVTLQTPAITAGDGGATSVPGFEQFYGTSAAAPTAAGIAALVLELNPELTGAQLRTLLESSCLDIEATGYENNSGNGILMANLVLGQTPTSAAGTLALGGSFFTVNEADETISIPIVRLGGSEGEVGLTITTTNGTASESSDFTLPEGLVTLEDEVTMLDVPISIADPANQSEANETFTVSISEPTGGAILGLTTTAKVLIIDSTTDKAKPTVKITTPAANAKITEEDVATVTITGTAADKKGVSHVWVKLNSGAFVEATIPVEELGGPAVTYSLIVAPEDGLNKLEVKSEDYAGNVSSVVKRSFTVVKTRDLYVEISGAEDAGSLTSGFQGTSSRELGKSYTISAKAKAGFVFDGWTTNEFTAAEIGVTDQDLENPNLTFIMREYLELTANFIENPFVAEVVGTFNGLAAPEEGTIFGVDTVGYLSVLVSSKGSFSGSLMIDDSALKFSGVFDNGGVAHFGKTKTTALTLTRKGDKPDIGLSLILDLEEDSGLITGTVVQKSEGEVVAVSDVELDRAEYSRTNPVPEEYAGNKGQRYNLLLPSAAQDNLQTNEYPQGNGIGSMFVKTDGKVTFAGLLADNTKFTASTTLSRDQKSPFFVQLYSRKGSIAVPVTLDLTQDDTDALGEDGFWFRPEITKSQYYPNGWAEGVIFNLVGSQFSVPQDLSVIPFLPPVDVTESNATLSFSSGLLDGFVDYGVNISPSNKVTEVPADSSYTLALKKTTGEISGTFTHTDGKKVPFKGTTFQKEGIYQGTSGFFLSPSSKPVNGEGESGLVELVPADL
ncbi:MAG: S8 family serine peptidase, partial [Prosthecobacter sp.]|nr:S8 family serine peptidase [Prosthecobacter sp.]